MRGAVSGASALMMDRMSSSVVVVVFFSASMELGDRAVIVGIGIVSLGLVIGRVGEEEEEEELVNSLARSASAAQSVVATAQAMRAAQAACAARRPSHSPGRPIFTTKLRRMATGMPTK